MVQKLSNRSVFFGVYFSEEAESTEVRAGRGKQVHEILPHKSPTIPPSTATPSHPLPSVSKAHLDSPNLKTSQVLSGLAAMTTGNLFLSSLQPSQLQTAPTLHPQTVQAWHAQLLLVFMNVLYVALYPQGRYVIFMSGSENPQERTLNQTCENWKLGSSIAIYGALNLPHKASSHSGLAPACEPQNPCSNHRDLAFMIHWKTEIVSNYRDIQSHFKSINAHIIKKNMRKWTI